MQKVWPDAAEDELWSRDKFAVANLGQKLGSHGLDFGGVSLSPGLGVQRTTILEILGSNKLVCRASPL